MSVQRHLFISAVHLVLVKGQKILLLRRYQTGYEDGNFSLPAGHIDQAETATQAIVREAREEIGVDIERKNLKLMHVLHRNGNDHERIDFFFKVKRWRGEPMIGEPEKCDQLVWCDETELPCNTVDYIKFVLEKVSGGEIYSEFGWN